MDDDGDEDSDSSSDDEAEEINENTKPIVHVCMNLGIDNKVIVYLFHYSLPSL
jgi:hypothetical protein